MPDGFPTLATDEDSRVQNRISRSLEICRYLETEFEKNFPLADPSNVAAILARQRNRPKAADLYIGLRQDGPGQWLGPLLRRLRWLKGQGEGAVPGKWRFHLSAMVGIVVGEIDRLSEEQFIELAADADCLEVPSSLACMDKMLSSVLAMERKGPLNERLTQALRQTMEADRGLHKAVKCWEKFAWPLFRSPYAFPPGDPCWAAAVRRDLDQMDPELRAVWLPVFNATDTRLAGACELSGGCENALIKLGKAKVETGLRRWIGLLRELPSLTLSPLGMTIFRHTLLLCQKLGGTPCDDLLYDVARAPWKRAEDVEWLETYLWILGRRSKDRSFACLEALAMNPATRTDEVQRDYDTVVTAFMGEARGVGVDGFQWDCDPALEAHQREIERVLQMAKAAVDRGPYIHPTVVAHGQAIIGIPEEKQAPLVKAWLAQMTAPKPWFDPGPEFRASLDAMRSTILKKYSEDSADLFTAAANRWEWICKHHADYPKELVKAWRDVLVGFGCEGGLLQQSLAKVKELPQSRLLTAIRSTPGKWKVYELVRQHAAEHGWDAETAQAFHDWIPTLGNSRTDCEYRAKAEWLLWFEDVLPLAPETFWGESVRRDLRKMEPAERAGWVALLGEGAFSVVNKPPKKWLAAAEAAFPKIGVAIFRRRFKAWFAPFAAAEPLRLTVTGRNVLRLLIWSALIAEDPKVDDALAGFARAQWKTKESHRCAAQAEMAFSYVLAERAPEKALPILEEMVRSGRAYAGSASYKTYQSLCARLGRQR